MNDRVAIFIDGSNLYHSLKNNFKRYDLNFAEFARKLCGTRRLIRTYYYNVLQDPSQRVEGTREQGDFLDTLRKTQYLELRLGTTKLAQGIPVEKGIDVMLATDLLYFAANNSYDIAILVSGDADFSYTLQVVKNMGKHVEVAYFEHAVSKDLLTIADNLHPLDTKFFTGLWTSSYKRPKRNKPARRRQMVNAPVVANRVSSEDINPHPPESFGASSHEEFNPPLL
ncbi:MAG: NYN domain-containing protein [Chloroflexi bacterium]|nr:NYN domain-containing protein [Chloroflexota bacterium]